MTADQIAQGLPRLATVENAAEVFAPAGETPAAIRANIFKADDRFNSRGEKIKGNGLAATGAIIRRGRKVLIDLDAYGRWLAGRPALCPTEQPTAADAEADERDKLARADAQLAAKARRVSRAPRT